MAQFDLVVRGGTVATSAGVRPADVGVKAGVIGAIAQIGQLNDAELFIDASNEVVVPGGIDPHVHTSQLLGEFSTLDNFFESTRAAAWGGTTTLVDFAIPSPPGSVSPLTIAEQRMGVAIGQATIDVAFHACITRADSEALSQIPKLAAMGLTTVKAFTIYKDVVQLPLDELHATMKAVAAVDGLMLIHAESPHLVEPAREEFARSGQTDARHHALSRPPISELDMVRTIIELLRITGCAGYIVHVSTPEAALEIAKARLADVRVWAETCPHYVFLDDAKYDSADGDLYICSPPLRSRESADHLWRLIQAGAIQVWGSDHCCYSVEQKRKYPGDFLKAPNGLPGVEVRAPLLFSQGVQTGKISLDQFVAMTATNPACLNGLYPQKGVIAPGADADIAIYNPEAEIQLTAAGLHMASDYTPFEGITVKGWPETVIAHGRTVVDRTGGGFVGERGRGRILVAGAPVLI